MGVQVSCCQNAVPNDLDLEISASGDCACDNGLTFTLSWNGFNWADSTIGGYVLSCTCSGWVLNGPGGEGFINESPISEDCDPFELVFEVFCSEEDDTKYTVTITEASP